MSSHFTDLLPRGGAANEAQPDPGSAPWHRAVVAGLGAEVATPLTAALQRVTALAVGGSIDRASLRALHEELAQARRVAIMAQQLARLHAGVTLSPEALDLGALLEDLVAQRGRESAERGVSLRVARAPGVGRASLVTDATLAHTLIAAVLDWGLELARSALVWRIELAHGDRPLRLICQFAHRAAGAAELDTMSWRLVQACARALGAPCERIDAPGSTQVNLAFAALPEVARAAVAPAPFLLGRRHVLALCADPALRAEVAQALHGSDVVLDFCDTLAQAQRLCHTALPHALLYEAGAADAGLARLRQEIVTEWPGFVTVEITDGEHPGLALGEAAAGHHARVARGGLGDATQGALREALSAPRTRP